MTLIQNWPYPKDEIEDDEKEIFVGLDNPKVPLGKALENLADAVDDS